MRSRPRSCPGFELLGMAEAHREAALAMARRFNIPDIQSAHALMAREDIDLVYIATPPFLQYPRARG